MTGTPSSAQRLLERQLEAARRADGAVDVDELARLVAASYETFDRDRRRVDRANRLMTEELDSASEQLAQAVEKLRVNNSWLEAALNNMGQGLCLLGAGARIVLCNARFSTIFGLPEPASLCGSLLEPAIAASTAFGNLSAEAMRGAGAYIALVHGPESATAEIALADGRILRVVHQPTGDGGSVQTCEDITDRHRAEATIAHLATHDVLTNLPNRRLLGQRLGSLLRTADGRASSAVLCLDLDRFKSVNDSLGHTAGDRLLQEAAERIRACTRERDTVARLGGDEFAVIAEGPISQADVEALATRVVESVSRPYLIDHCEVLIGVSIGIAMAPRDGSDAERLVKCADMAMYRAKQRGRGCYEVFSPEMDTLAQARRSLEMDLRRAVSEGQFFLEYQPVVSIESGRICAAEALLRWDSPTRGRVAPDAFIPLAEELGLIVLIGEWVMRRACRAAAGWPDDVKVAVNVSARQFIGDGLVDVVQSALDDAGIAPDRLELEITETVLMNTEGGTLDTLHRLRSMGVGIVMDDFGTGYSSLAYLRSFPFDKIKIDRSFVSGLGKQADATAIVRAVTILCENLGMKSTAEGVETAEQLTLLGDERCTEAQGFHLGRPCPESRLLELFASAAATAESAAC